MAKVASLAEMLESEQFISRFFERSSVGLAVFDHRLRYRMLNPYLAGSDNAPIECHLGKHVREILGEVARQVEVAIDQVFLTGSTIVNYEIEGTLPTRPEGGHWIYDFFPIADSKGKIAHVGVVVVDLGLNVQLELVKPTCSTSAVLRSWKEIAQYLHTSVKTLQRWERAYSLPIRRVVPNKGSVVFAFQEDIETWLHSRCREPNSQVRNLWKHRNGS